MSFLSLEQPGAGVEDLCVTPAEGGADYTEHRGGLGGGIGRGSGGGGGTAAAGNVEVPSEEALAAALNQQPASVRGTCA